MAKGNTPLTALRLPDALLARVDALIPILERTPEGAAAGVSRSYVMRLALARGLDALEADHGTPKRRKSP